MCKGYQKIASSKEVENFVSNAKSLSSNDKITVSKIKDDTKERIRNLANCDLNRVLIDKGSVIHTLEKEIHHVSEADFKKIGRIVNSTSDITIQPKNHQNNKVLLFKEQKDNGLNIVMEVRAGKHNLALITMYRVKKAK